MVGVWLVYGMWSDGVRFYGMWFYGMWSDGVWLNVGVTGVIVCKKTNA